MDKLFQAAWFFAIAVFLTFAGPGGAAVYNDWAECALDTIPGMASPDGAAETMAQCKSRYPEPQKKSSGCGSYTIGDCVKAHAKGPEPEDVLGLLRQACGEYFSAEITVNPSYKAP